jgi:hypothetical protein
LFDIGCQIFATPGQSGKARAGFTISTEAEDRSRGFRGDRQDACVAVGQVVQRFPHGNAGIEQVHVRAGLRLGQDDAVRPGGHDVVQIAVGKAAVERIDAHIERRAAVQRDGRLQEIKAGPSGFRLVVGGNGILQIENQGIGAAIQRLGELAAVVTGNEQE